MVLAASITDQTWRTKMAAFAAPDKLSFSGKEIEDLEKFLSKVEMYCIALGLAEKEEQQCAVLDGLLEDVAYQSFLNFPQL